MTYPANPFTPVGNGGANLPASTRRRLPFIYIYDRTLTALQAVTNDSVSIETGSDFMLLGWYISSSTGSFQVRLGDSSGFYFSNGLQNSSNISAYAGMPVPFLSPVFYPRGSRIVIDVTDTSNATNAIELAFVGVKVY